MPITARGNNAFQLAVAMAPGVSIRARVVPAMEASTVPRMVWGRVNLYKALSLARSDPDSMAVLDFSMAFGSKSPSTAKLSVVVVVDDDGCSLECVVGLLY